MSIINTEHPINIMEIMKYMPHRYPFLLVDRVIDVTPGKKISVIKNVTINEPFFTGHFPDYPVMPGVLIIESMAQAAGILSILTHGPKKDNELYFFAAINNAKFKRQVIPGDTLTIEVEMMKVLRGVGIYNARVLVDNNVAAIAEITVAKKEV
ncbi:MAG: 3-hydroxyacyl-ACP dehydratase FabZ [Proteobacteria bacterium]|jgi:3-hydroxyacyl-[acyl-carrier-protein] dehydratase|nr:3-hydroxyacyl-ACP dehydratase FabZ [Pseudomonadota bacterium]